MIVNIGAWFYLVSAGLAFLSIPLSPIELVSASTLMTVILAGLFAAMGYGLLQREKWGRWLALGCSLLGWTLVGLALIVLLGYLLFVAKVGMLVALLLVGGIYSALAWLVLLVIVLWAAGVYISFKLFWYLCSPEGCEEFGEPPISAPTVVASVGAWLVLSSVNYLAAGGGRFLPDSVDPGEVRDRQEETSRSELRDYEQQRMSRDLEAQRAAAASARREAEINAQLEAAIAEEATRADEAQAGEAQSGEVQAEVGAAAPDESAVAEASPQPEALDVSPGSATPAPTEEAQAPAVPDASAAPAKAKDGDAPSSRKIIKCRDSSGGVTFTQGYCPPGSKQVDMS